MEEVYEAADLPIPPGYEEALDRIELRVMAGVYASGQRRVRVCYSAYEEDGSGVPLDNLDQVAVKGRCVLVGPADEYFGGPRSREYRSEVLENPTWLQVAVHANAAIAVTRDRHHVFLEGLWPPGTGGGVAVCRFRMGS
jgi:hypothetical protein